MRFTDPRVYTDELTGVLNRRGFERNVARTLARCERIGRGLTLLALDLDHFKEVNDTFGHQAGDRLLREFAERLRLTLRDRDLAARLGGDEFVILMPGLERDSAPAVLERLKERLEAPRSDPQDPPIRLTGGWSFFPHDGREIGELLEKADRALYNAKHAGRGHVQVYDPVAQRRSVSSLRASRLIGRGMEQAAFLTAAEACLAGETRLFLIEGEAGIGKTRLAEHLSRLANGRGFGVIVTHCMDAPAPYHLCAELLEDWRQHQPESFAAAVRLLPLPVAELLEEVLSGTPASSGRVNDVDPNAVAFMTESLVAARELERPVTLVIEDLQWADEASLGILAGMTQRLRRRRILIIATMRTDGSALPAGLPRWMERMGRDSRLERVVLPPLSRPDHDRLVRAILGTSPRDEILAVLFAQTEGNPFYLEEILKSLAEQGTLVTDERGWTFVPEADVRITPSSVRAVLEGRLARLPEAARELIECAAVLGREFNDDLLIDMSGIPMAEADAALEAILAARLFVDAGSDESLLGFAHFKIQEVALAGMTDFRRRRLHRRAAEALERRNQGTVEQLAFHFRAGGLEARSIGYYVAAAERARTLYANAEARSAYAIAERLLLAAQPGLQAHIAEIRGDLPFLPDVVLARLHAGALDVPAEAAGQFSRIAVGMAEIEERGGRPRETLHFGELAAIVGLSASDPGLVAWGLYWTALAFMRLGNRRAAAQLAAIVHERFAVLEDPYGRAQTYNLDGNIAVLSRDYPHALDSFLQSLALRQTLKLPHAVALSLNNIGIVNLMSGDVLRAQSVIEDAVEATREAGNLPSYALALNNLAYVTYLRGELADSEKLFREVLTLRREQGDASSEGIALANLARLHFDLGLREEAWSEIEAAIALGESLGIAQELVYWYNQRGSMLREDGKLQAALDEHLANRERCARLEEDLALAACDLELAKDHLAAGDLEAARAAWRNGRREDRQEPQVRTAFAIFEGTLRRRDGDPDGALQLLASSAAELTKLGRIRERFDTYAPRLDALLAAGYAVEAETLRQEARCEAERMGLANIRQGA